MTYYVRKPQAGLLQVAAQEITEADTVDIVKSIIGRSPVQANRILSYLKRAFKVARSVSRRPHSPAPAGVDFTLIAANPAEYVERDSTAEKVGERVLDIGELRAPLEAVRTDTVISWGMKAVFTLAATTGCRGGELRRLRWKDVDMNGRTLTIPADVLKTGQMGGNEKTHTAAIGDIGWYALQAACEACYGPGVNAGSFICPHPRHGGSRRRGAVGLGQDATRPIAAVLLGRNLKRLLERHWLEPFVVQDLRRTAVTLMAEVGVPHESVCRQVGHAFGNPINAKHYDKSLHLAEKRQAVAALEDWILGRRDVGDVLQLAASGIQ